MIGSMLCSCAETDYEVIALAGGQGVQDQIVGLLHSRNDFDHRDCARRGHSEPMTFVHVVTRQDIRILTT